MKKYLLTTTAALMLIALPALAQTTPGAMVSQQAVTPNAAAQQVSQTPTQQPTAPQQGATAAAATPAPAGAGQSCSDRAAAQAAMLSSPTLAPSLAKLYGNRVSAFNTIDTDCDGFISSAEWQAANDARFAAADANHDGSLSKDESAAIVAAFKAAAEQDPNIIASTRANTLENRLDNIDGNGDGIISKAEWDAYFNARFTKLDRNSDGKLDLTEYQTDDEEARRRRTP